MESLNPVPTLKFFHLLKRDRKSLYITNVVTASSVSGISLGSGFFLTRQEAEMHRTAEMLKDGDKNEYYIFELEIPNPVANQ